MKVPKPGAQAALRHDSIRRAIEVDGRVSIADLKDRLGVTEVTIREDLSFLESAKMLKRIRGGAVVTRNGADPGAG
jgi:DeoR family fructose operon transcriptional repressor